MRPIRPRSSASVSALVRTEGIARSQAWKPLTLAPTTRHRVATAWFARSAATNTNLLTRSPGRKKRRPSEDLDLLLQPLVLPLQPLGLGLLGLAGGQRLRGARGQVLVAP